MLVFILSEESRPQKSYPQSYCHARTTIPGHQVKSREYLPEFERPKKTPLFYGEVEGIYMCIHQYNLQLGPGFSGLQ